MSTYPRRAFLARGMQGVGLMGLATGLARAGAGEGTEPAELVGKAVGFLRPRQGSDGSWSGNREPGITALVLTASLRSGQVTPAEPAVTKGLGFLERYIGPKGGLSGAPHSVYTTSVALMAFQEANQGGRHNRTIKDGQAFLKATQLDEGRGRGATIPPMVVWATAEAIAGRIYQTPRSLSKPYGTRACPPMTQPCRKP